MVLSKRSFSTSIVIPMSNSDVSRVLSCGCWLSVWGTGSTSLSPRTSSARWSIDAFGFISGVDTALVGRAFSCFALGPLLSGSLPCFLGVPAFSHAVVWFWFFLLRLQCVFMFVFLIRLLRSLVFSTVAGMNFLI